MKNKIIILIFMLVFLLSQTSAVLLSDQGTDVKEVATGNLVNLSDLTIFIYDDPTGGNLIFSQTFPSAVVNGSWNVMINPNLEFGKIYYKDYKINNDDLDFDGNERLSFQSPLGMINNVSFINFSLINSCPLGSSIRQIYENGSVECETDDSSGSDSYNDSWINSAIDNKISVQNTSIVNWITLTFIKLADIVGLVGNWSADKVNYYNTTQVNDINTSMKNYVDYINSTNGVGSGNYNDAWINNTIDSKINTNNDSVKNYILYVNSTNSAGGTDTFIANYSQFLLNNQSLTNFISSNNGSIINYIGIINLSMKNYVDYVNSTNSAGGINWDIAMNGTLFRTNQWNATNTSYLTGDNFTIQNNSIKNYILYVNSTNGAGTSYVDSWINGTIDSKILTNNNSLLNWIVNTYNTTRNNYVDLQNTSQTNLINLNNLSMANYVLYVNSTNGAGGISWATAANGTLFLTSQWNATNTSYYLDTNPKGFYNSTSNIGNWTNDKSTYTPLSVLNNGSYFNTATLDTFIANYSTFLTHITWANVMNGTLFLTSQWNATNTSYMTGSNATIQNQSMVNYISTNNASLNNYILYVNSTNGIGSGDTFIANYSTFLTHIGWAQIVNGSIWSWVMNNTVVQAVTLNNGTYVIDTKLNNGSYLNVAETDSKAYNGTLVLNSALNNGTYVISSILNNGSYLNSIVDTDTFVTNYSTFLTHVTWANVMNGTLWSQMINATTEPKWNANYSQFLLNNVSITNSITANNASMDNFVDTKLSISQWNATNISYMTGDNFTLQNTSINNYILYVNSTNGNGGISWAIVTNGTLFQTSQWNATNTSYLTTETDSKAYNGTLALMLTLNNGSYLNSATSIDWSNIINGSIWSWVMNNTVVQATTLNNGTYALTNNLNNGSYLNVAETDSKAYNGSLALMLTLNNGSYLNPATSDTFIANYSTFLTHIGWAQIVNGSIWSWVMNNTVVQAVTLNNGTYALTNNLNNGTYVIAQTLNNGSYLNVAETEWRANYTNMQTACGAGYYVRSVFSNGTLECAQDQTAAGGITEWINYTSVNYTSTSSTIMTPILNLNTSLLANVYYGFECWLGFQTNVTTNGIRVGIQTDTTPSLIWYTAKISQAADGTDTYFEGDGTTRFDNITSTAVAAANTNYTAIIKGHIQHSTNTFINPYFLSENNTRLSQVTTSYCRWTKLNG